MLCRCRPTAAVNAEAGIGHCLEQPVLLCILIRSGTDDASPQLGCTQGLAEVSACMVWVRFAVVLHLQAGHDKLMQAHSCDGHSGWYGSLLGIAKVAVQLCIVHRPGVMCCRPTAVVDAVFSMARCLEQ